MGLNHDAVFRPPAVGNDQAPRFPFAGPYIKYDTRNATGISFLERFVGDGLPTFYTVQGVLPNEGLAGSGFNLDAFATSLLGSYRLEFSGYTMPPGADFDALFGGPPSAGPYCLVYAVSDVFVDPFWGLPSEEDFVIGFGYQGLASLSVYGILTVALNRSFNEHGFIDFCSADFPYATTGLFADQMQPEPQLFLDSVAVDPVGFANSIIVQLLDPTTGLCDTLAFGAWHLDDPNHGHDPADIIATGNEWWGTGVFEGGNPVGYPQGRRAYYRDIYAITGGEYLPGNAMDDLMGASDFFSSYFSTAIYLNRGVVPDVAWGHPFVRGFALYRGVPTLSQLASIAADFGCTLSGGIPGVSATPPYLASDPLDDGWARVSNFAIPMVAVDGRYVAMLARLTSNVGAPYLVIIDASSALYPSEVSRVAISGLAPGGSDSFFDPLAAANGYVYVANGASDTVLSFDVTDPSNPVLHTTFVPRPGFSIRGLITSPDGSALYVAISNSIAVVDISDPLNPDISPPDIADNIVYPPTRRGMAIIGSYLYCGSAGSVADVYRMDISNPLVIGAPVAGPILGATPFEVTDAFLFAVGPWLVMIDPGTTRMDIISTTTFTKASTFTDDASLWEVCPLENNQMLVFSTAGAGNQRVQLWQLSTTGTASKLGNPLTGGNELAFAGGIQHQQKHALVGRNIGSPTPLKVRVFRTAI